MLSPVEPERIIPNNLMKDDKFDLRDETNKFAINEVDQFNDNRIYPEASKPQLVLQCLCLLYPVYYETLQLMK